jgi:hypothetical protein
MIIAILSHFEVIKETLTYSQEEVSSGLSNFLVCIEMFIAALAHHKYYGYRVSTVQRFVAVFFAVAVVVALV